jgi:hypothetical protein
VRSIAILVLLCAFVSGFNDNADKVVPEEEHGLVTPVNDQLVEVSAEKSKLGGTKYKTTKGGKCLTSKGGKAKFKAYHGVGKAKCEAKCNKSKACKGYSVSTTKYCLIYHGMKGLTAGGTPWGGCSCSIKVVESKKKLKKAVVKAMKRESPRARKNIKKNAAMLKAYSQLAASKVRYAQASKQVLGSLVLGMAKTSKKDTPASQYRAVLAKLKFKFNGGLTGYIVKAVAKAMASKGGLLVISPITAREGTWVHIDGSFLGLADPYNLVEKLAVRARPFQVKLAFINSAGARLAHKKHLTALARKNAVKKYNYLFKTKCLGSGACRKFGKKTCLKTVGCVWRPAWHGDVAALQDKMQTMVRSDVGTNKD